MSGLLRTTLLGLLAFLAIAALGTGGFLAGDLEFSWLSKLGNLSFDYGFLSFDNDFGLTSATGFSSLIGKVFD